MSRQWLGNRGFGRFSDRGPRGVGLRASENLRKKMLTTNYKVRIAGEDISECKMHQTPWRLGYPTEGVLHRSPCQAAGPLKSPFPLGFPLSSLRAEVTFRGPQVTVEPGLPPQSLAILHRRAKRLCSLATCIHRGGNAPFQLFCAEFKIKDIVCHA